MVSAVFHHPSPSLESTEVDARQHAREFLLRQRARRQMAEIGAPLGQVQQGLQWMQKPTLPNAIWALTAASLLFGKTRTWGLKALRLMRLWCTLRAALF
jgi:hypothetical protein